LYQLTGTPIAAAAAADDDDDGNISKRNVGGLFMTDVSNASRWLFLDLESVQWDKKLIDAVCSPHQVPMTSLPQVKASSEVYAILKKDSTGIDKLEGVPVSAILGDQQAALFGQVAFEPGEAKNTYGTGMFLMMNTGTKLVQSHHGLLSTIAYKINDDVIYALEGSVSHSGSTIQWLRDQMGMIEKASDSEAYASDHNDGLYMVPAFAGLFAPYWRSDARGCIVGITAAHHKGHILRAALEAAAYQARELFDAIYADSKVLLKALKVDGGGTHNKLLMQFQADMINAPVVIPRVQETTAMGAAFAAGLAVGVWENLSEIKSLWQVAETYTPKMSADQRNKNWLGWKKAVTKSLGWVEIEDDHEHFLDAQTFDIDANGVAIAVEDTSSGREISSKRKQSVNANVAMALVAAVGVGAGFLLGSRKK
jgi:glycerol kinase